MQNSCRLEGRLHGKRLRLLLLLLLVTARTGTARALLLLQLQLLHLLVLLVLLPLLLLFVVLLLEELGVGAAVPTAAGSPAAAAGWGTFFPVGADMPSAASAPSCRLALGARGGGSIVAGVGSSAPPVRNHADVPGTETPRPFRSSASSLLRGMSPAVRSSKRVSTVYHILFPLQ